MQKSNSYITYWIFTLCLLTRISFKYLSGYNNFELFGDALRYDMLSDRILHGNFNLDMVAFITAPLYPWAMAITKWIAPSHWAELLTLIQFILVSMSAVYIFRLGKLIFQSERAALISSVIYIFYPLTMWYNFTFTQETFFQCFFIFFFFYFIKCLTAKGQSSFIKAVLFFCLCFLTKTYVILLLPFLLTILWISKSFWKSLAFFLVFLAAAIPNALINYSYLDAFSLTGFSAGSMFLIGHSDEGYQCLTKEIYQYPDIIESGCNLDIVFHPPYEFDHYGQVNKMPMAERNLCRLKIGVEWIKDNPKKFFELKWNGLVRFVMPGLDYRIYNSFIWFVTLIYSLLFYIPAYIVLFQSLKKKKMHAFFSLSVILSIAILFIVFYPQNRFRVIGMETLLIVYAGSFYSKKLKK